MTRRSAILICGVALALTLTGCEGQLTNGGGPDLTAISSAPGEITVSAPVGSNGDTRDMFWSSSGVREAGATECATWASGKGLAQDALAFDIRSTKGGLQAITIERNIWGYAFWDFIAITWDTTSTSNAVADGSVDLSSYLGTGPTDVFPLQVCARMVGSTLQFEVAKRGDAIQAWGNTARGGDITTRMPSNGVTGATGVYFGHMAVGTSAQMTNVTIDGTPAARLGVAAPARASRR